MPRSTCYWQVTSVRWLMLEPLSNSMGAHEVGEGGEGGGAWGWLGWFVALFFGGWRWHVWFWVRHAWKYHPLQLLSGILVLSFLHQTTIFRSDFHRRLGISLSLSQFWPFWKSSHFSWIRLVCTSLRLDSRERLGSWRGACRWNGTDVSCCLCSSVAGLLTIHQRFKMWIWINTY